MKIQRLKDGRFRDSATGKILVDAEIPSGKSKKVYETKRSSINYFLFVIQNTDTEKFMSVLQRNSGKLGSNVLFKSEYFDKPAQAAQASKNFLKQKIGSVPRWV